MVNMTLTISRPAILVTCIEYAPAWELEAGATVEYLGHMPGGNVKVSYLGGHYLMDPNATKELGRKKG